MANFKAALKKLGKGWKAAKQEASKNPDFENNPDGVYLGQLVGADLEQSKGSNRWQVRWTWTYLDGEFKGKNQLDFDGLEGKEDALVWLGRKFVKLGYDAGDLMDDFEGLQDFLKEIVGERIVAKFRLKSKGEYQNFFIEKLIDNPEDYITPDDLPIDPAPSDEEGSEASEWPTREEILGMDEEALTVLNTELGEPIVLDEVETWEEAASQLADAIEAAEPEEGEESDGRNEPEPEPEEPEAPAEESAEYPTREEILAMDEDALTELNDSLEVPTDLDSIETWEEAAVQLADIVDGLVAEPEGEEAEESEAGEPEEVVEEENDLAAGTLVEFEYKGDPEQQGSIQKVVGDVVHVVMHGKENKGKVAKVKVDDIFLIE